MLRVEDEGLVRTVAIDRPDRRNALTVAQLDELREAVVGATTSVVYLCGRGSAFCAGADLDEVAELTPETAVRFAERGQAALDAIEESPPVVVAGIDGPAYGGGVELALAADVRVATPDASFAEPGVAMGIFGTWGGTIRLPHVVGLGEAMDFALSGRTIDAEEALRMGLVSRIVETPRRVVDELAAHPPDALRVVRDRLRDAGPAGEQRSAEAAAFGELIESHGDAIAASRD